MIRRLAIILALWVASAGAWCQAPAGTNYDESKVPPYHLPDPLLLADGRMVKTTEEWNRTQRPYLYSLFEKNVYGRYPTKKIAIRSIIRETGRWSKDTHIVRKVIRILLADTSSFIDLLIFLPAHASGPVPVFLGYNFDGNASAEKSPEWPVREVVSHGFGLATAWYGDIEVDNPDGWKTGIRTRLRTILAIEPGEWGAIDAWAWGLSRIMDCLEQDPAVDTKKIALIGHSRLGKTALWAGASDTRFSIIISNESGEGGAALSRRIYGETIKNLNDEFPHWFSPAYKKYNDHTDLLPVDQHELISLLAPRPVYVASAEGDRWSDPRGEFLSAVRAGPVYALFGKKGIGTENLPPLRTPVGHTLRYHIRPGKHGILLYDWQQYLSFAGDQWKL